MTPAGIEPATFRFVAQHLNHCATAVPTYKVYLLPNRDGKTELASDLGTQKLNTITNKITEMNSAFASGKHGQFTVTWQS